jgi:hypothetical protein
MYHLVLAGSGLAGLKLVEVPAADLHVALVVVHALGEVLGGTGAVVAVLLGLVLRGLLGLRGLGSRGAATEEAAYGMADGGANRDTSSCAGHLAEETGALRGRGRLGSRWMRLRGILRGRVRGGRTGLLGSRALGRYGRAGGR